MRKRMKSYQKFIVSVLLCLAITSASSYLQAASQANTGPFLVLNNPSDSGMFAVFGSVLGALNFYENGSYAGLKIDLNSGRYLDPEKGPNWWEYFFEPICLGDESALAHHFSIEEYVHLALHAIPHDRNRAFELIQRYVHVKPDIQTELDAFVNNHFMGHYMIGVHHRGTDKVTEWPLVPYKKTCEILRKIIKELPKEHRQSVRIYVATDEENFITYISQQFPRHVIYNDFARSCDATPLHDYGANFYQNNYQMGKEALLDCLLLSKCHVLVYPSSSCLSNIARYFNPRMRAIPLSHL